MLLIIFARLYMPMLLPYYLMLRHAYDTPFFFIRHDMLLLMRLMPYALLRYIAP